MLDERTRRRTDTLVIFTLFLLVFAASSQVMIVAPLLPQIARELHVSESGLGVIASGYTLTLALFALVIGPISDRVGRRAVLVAGSAWLTVALALHGFAATFETLVAARVLAGVGGGILTGAAVSYLGDHFPYERRGVANGWVMSGYAVGQVLAIPLGTVLARDTDFRTPFLVFAGVMAASSLLILVGLPQPVVKRASTRLGVGEALREYGRLLRVPAARSVALVYASIFFGYQALVTFIPTWLEDSFSASSHDIAWMFFFGGIASIVAGPIAGRVSDAVGRRPIVIVSVLGMAALAATLPVAVRGLVSAYVCFFLAMVLTAGRVSPLQALLPSLVSEEKRGTLSSFVVATGQLFGGLGGLAGGAVYERFGFDAEVWLTVVAMLVAAALVTWAVPEPKTHPTG
jgi:predicted MFS family arabinose efflux permease